MNIYNFSVHNISIGSILVELRVTLEHEQCFNFIRAKAIMGLSKT